MNAVAYFHLKKFMGSKFVGLQDGAEWHALRKSLGKFTLSTDSLKAAYAPMSQVSSELIAWLDETLATSGGQTVMDVHTPLHAFTLDAVALATFGSRIGGLDALKTSGSIPVVDAMEFGLDEMTRRIGSFNPLDWDYMGLTPTTRKLRAAHRLVNKTVEDLVSATLDMPKANVARSITEAMADHADGKQAAIDNAIGMVWAGHDTTAAALSFALKELAAQPELQQRLHDELKTVDVTSSFIAVNKGNPLLDAVANETLRLHPPATWTARTLISELVLDGIPMPAGTMVFIPIWAAHRSPQNFVEPDKFMPDRWFDLTKTMRDALIPFGAGNRICPGNRFAGFEFKLMLAKLILRYEFRLAGPSYPQGHAVNNGTFQQCKDNFLSIARRDAVQCDEK